MNKGRQGDITLAIIIPCYNEEAVLPETAKRLQNKINALIAKSLISDKSKIVFVDDGSQDASWKLITNYHTENPHLFSGIKLSKNRGHQNALLCGLLTMKDFCDAAVSIDADLQDDIEIIDKMISQYKSGSEIVYGVRSERKKDTVFKRISAQCFYSFMKMLGVDIIYNHADYRLMGKNSLNALSQYREVNLFLRGIIPMLGYKTSFVYYARAERFAGESKYPLRKMLKFAFEGITSFSIKPIRCITTLGIIIFTVSLVMIAYSLIQYFGGRTVLGWSSMICSLWGIGGLILLGLGITGEYIGKIYLETKKRPRFTIEEMLCEAADAGH
ncbi:MAG: glycosyltransferase family 2 protein [Treponema sp.]|jgi:glycosyltransferase involved in cell wall biosynthesis|nr:glycosyltransferase family 2 protein [Treponema sp.]